MCEFADRACLRIRLDVLLLIRLLSLLTDPLSVTSKIRSILGEAGVTADAGTIAPVDPSQPHANANANAARV